MTRQEMFNTMVIHPTAETAVIPIISKMKVNKDRYAAIKPPIPWHFIAVVHQMEAEQDFTKYLGNGQPLSMVTTKVPKGRGPFDTFEAGAIDALEQRKLIELPVSYWNMDNELYELEGYNGYGYSLYHHMPSPYVFAGTNYYTKGKYEEIRDASGQYKTHFNPDLVSNQIGVAVLLKYLLEN